MAKYEMVIQMFGGRVLCENEPVMIRNVDGLGMFTGKPIWRGRACELGALVATAIGLVEPANKVEGPHDEECDCEECDERRGDLVYAAETD